MALQLGGSDPAALAAAARLGAAAGYDEINLNVGCPSDRVQSGRFGACLMREPELVAECMAAMGAAVKVPVTVKCRIGVDEQEPEESLGGQAFWSFGGLFLIDSPEQRRLRVHDSLELARQDWLGTAGFDRTEDHWPRQWAHAYVDFAGVAISRWAYELCEDPDGCVVTESWTDRRNALARGVSPLITGVKDRRTHNRVTMEQTLDNLQRHAERTARL